MTIRHTLWLLMNGIRSGYEYAYGDYKLSKLKTPIVTIFGGTLIDKNDFYAQQAYAMARLLAQQNISVITGGGPGIMEASNCGAAEYYSKNEMHKHTLGIGVIGVDADFVNHCAQVIRVHEFIIRKELLVRYSDAFIFFPGGVGTADELFGLLNYIKHNLLKPIPVILIGVNFWQSLHDWYHASLQQHLIKPEASHFFIITDDLHVALEKIQRWLESKK